MVTDPNPFGFNIKSEHSVFPNPFLDYSTLYMPRNMSEVFDWAEFLWLTNGTYRAAQQRVVRYFITDIVLEGSDDTTEIKKYKNLLVDDIHILTQLTNIGDDIKAVGNSFTSLYEPLDRFLKCTKCHTVFPITKIDFKFRDFQFVGNCIHPECKATGVKFEREDRKSNDLTRYRVIRWNAREIKINYSEITGDAEYYWRIPETIKKSVKGGDDTFILNTINWEIVEAIKADADFKFNKDKIKHLKETTICSIKAGGWGLPQVLSVLKQAWYIQILHRQNEAIAQDYILPFRVISPAPGPGSAQDPLLSMNMQGFMGQVRAMIDAHRRDPATYHTIPSPLAYQSLGAEGATLVTPQLLQNGIENLLNALGVPVELFNGNLKTVGSPLALRLFERMHADLASSLNDWLRWLVSQLATAMSWDEVTCRLRSATIAEDLELKQLLLQLQSANMVSKDTALSPWGIDAKAEALKVINEKREEAEQQAEAEREDTPSKEVQSIMDMNVAQQKEQELIDQGVVPDPNQGQEGGPPPPPEGPQSVSEVVQGENKSIYDMDTQATQTAQQLLGMPESDRRSQMIGLKKSDETMHALVVSKMKGMKNEAERVGGQQVIAQQYQGQPPPQ